MKIKFSEAETRIFWDNQINSLATDVLISYSARTLASMVLTVQYKHIFVVHEIGFPLPASSKCQVIIEIVDGFSHFTNLTFHQDIYVYWNLYALMQFGSSFNFRKKTTYPRLDPNYKDQTLMQPFHLYNGNL